MLAAERGAARNTLAAYTADLRRLRRLLAAPAGPPVHAADADPCAPGSPAWPPPGFAARTQARRLSAIRQFHRFLAREGIRPDDPTELLESPRLPASLPRALSEAEVEALIAAAAGLPGRRGPVAAAAVELLYCSGLRASELVSLPAGALRAEEGAGRGARQGRQGTPGAGLGPRPRPGAGGARRGRRARRAAGRRAGCSPPAPRRGT